MAKDLAKRTPQTLSFLNRARAALERAKSIDDIKSIRDKAEAARSYAKAAKLGLEIQNQAATIKLEAERKAGQALQGMEKNPGEMFGGSTMKPPGDYPTYQDLGVGKSQGHRWQLEASVPEDDFRAYVDTQTKAGREVTTNGLIKIAKQKVAIRDPDEGTVPRNNRGRVVNDITQLIKAKKTFPCIYADPPWSYKNQGTRAATNNHYPTMSIDEICEFPVEKLAAKNAHLHIWTTSSFLPDTFRVIEAWGFRYVSSFVWVKPRMGLGNYWRVSHEFLLLGVRGSLGFQHKNIGSWIEEASDGHGQKPDSVRDVIERVSPGPRLEMFARKPAKGWTVFGNRVA